MTLAALFARLAEHGSRHPAALLALLLGGAAALASAICDLRQRRIPNLIVLPATAGAIALFALAAAVPAAGSTDTPLAPAAWLAVWTALGGGLALAAVHLALALRGGVGGGDVKLALLLGTLLGHTGGWSAVVWGGTLGWICAGFAGFAVLARGSRVRHPRARSPTRFADLPFAPCLLAGSGPVILLALVLGPGSAEG